GFIQVRKRALGILVVAVAAIACDDGDETTPLGPLPDPLTYPVGEDGPFAVGYRTVDGSYTSPAGARELLVHVWYPTEAPAGESPSYAGLFPDDEAFSDAALARPAYDGHFPVLVHSHGH